MERISPSARLLAESNGIEWESLQGSGPAGQITDGDILEYLMRVMKGEAAAPSTPVDAPPPGWDGKDIELPAMDNVDAEALRAAGVDGSMLDMFERPQAAAAAPAPQVPPAALEVLEVAPAPVVVPPPPPPVVAPPPPPRPAPVAPPPPTASAPQPAAASAPQPEPIRPPEVAVPEEAVPEEAQPEPRLTWWQRFMRFIGLG